MVKYYPPLPAERADLSRVHAHLEGPELGARTAHRHARKYRIRLAPGDMERGPRRGGLPQASSALRTASARALPR